MSSRPSRPWATVREGLRWRGLLFSFLLGTREILRPFLYWHAWHIFSTDLERPPEPYAKEQVAVRVYVGENVGDGLIALLSSMDEISSAEIRSRLEQGNAVAVASVGGEAAGYMWMTFAAGLELAFGVNWILRPDEALRYGSFVVPRWRGLGIHSSVNHALNDYARRRGLKRTLASIGAFNRQSLNLAKHTRNPKIMTVILFHLRGVNWTFVKALGAPFASRFTRPAAKYVTRGDVRQSQEF